MHERKFRRAVGRYAACLLLGFFALPSTGAFSEFNVYENKQYISDIGLIQLHENIVKHSSISNGVVGVGIIHLETGRELYLNKNERFPMASAVKVPVAVQLMKLVDQGRVHLDSMVTIKRGDFSATDIIFRLVGGPSAVHRSMANAGIEGMSVNRPIYLVLSNIWGVTDLKENEPFSIPLLNKMMAKVSREERIEARRNFFTDTRDTSTPEAMAKLLEKIWRQDVLSSRSAELVLDIMGQSHGNHRIKGLLPPGTKVYHKTGTIRGGLSDVGIVELPNSAGHLVVVVFVKGGLPMNTAEQTMARIARDAFDYFQNTRAD
ncbi:MAG: serine hydrolase [Candidatus Latescibacterota bacterium]